MRRFGGATKRLSRKRNFSRIFPLFKRGKQSLAPSDLHQHFSIAAQPQRRLDRSVSGCLYNHHRRCVLPVVGEAEVPGADAFVRGNIGGRAGSREISGLSERVRPDFDILPEHRLSHPQSEGFYESLFCGKPQCQASGAVFSSGTELPFEFGEHSRLKPLAPALNAAFRAAPPAPGLYRPRKSASGQPISWSISRTARSMPTRTARAIIEWPMLNSSISVMFLSQRIFW